MTKLTRKEQRLVVALLKCKIAEEGIEKRSLILDDCFDCFALGKNITMPPTDRDHETLVSIQDPNGTPGESIQVKVLFTPRYIPSEEDPRFYRLFITVLGVFRYSTDAEIDFNALPMDTKDIIVEECEKALPPK